MLLNLYFILHALEWFFLVWILLTALHLAFSRFFFNRMIHFANWVIAFHGFEGQIAGTDKAFKIFRRDLWILLILNFIVLILIRII